MTAWKPKRFWKTVTVTPTEGGFSVLLDTRPVKTPGKQLLVLPTERLAQAVAAEWQAQEGLVRPETMPFTRTANSALEKVAPQQAEVVALLAAYGGSDLLCYRAPQPEALIARQVAAWDPILDWAAVALGARLNVTHGVMHINQDAEATARLAAQVAGLDPFRIAAFHDLVALSGSLVLACAVTHGRLTPAEAWAMSRIDETWQQELWGIDEDAAALAETKRRDFHQAAAFWMLCLPD